jgi:chromosome partitioning protein
MQVIVFASRESGVGKTTLAGHLAVQAGYAARGPVAIMDADPNGDLARWWNLRAAAKPVLVSSAPDRLLADIESLRRAGVSLLIVDAGPDMEGASTDPARRLTDLADIVVTPVRPGHSLPAGPVEEFAKPRIVVVNAVAPRSRITVEAAIGLSQQGAVAPGAIHQQAAIPASMANGETVVETAPESPAANEIRKLWHYLDGRLTRLRAARRDPEATADRISAAHAAVKPPLASKGQGAPIRSAAAVRAAGRRGGAGRSSRILVLALDPFNARVYHDMLEVRGYAVQTTERIEGWAAALESGTPDLILIELNAPDHPSAGFARDIARDPRFSATPIVAVTDGTVPDSQRIPATASISCEGHIAKPICFEDFYRPIESLLAPRHGHTDS